MHTCTVPRLAKQNRDVFDVQSIGGPRVRSSESRGFQIRQHWRATSGLSLSERPLLAPGAFASENHHLPQRVVSTLSQTESDWHRPANFGHSQGGRRSGHIARRRP
jgi:hypothetical protein